VKTTIFAHNGLGNQFRLILLRQRNRRQRFNLFYKNQYSISLLMRARDPRMDCSVIRGISKSRNQNPISALGTG
jgi:hypothetical protein